MSSQIKDERTLVAQTKHWVETVIITHNFCPFAKREFDNDKIRYQVIKEPGIEACLEQLIHECLWLDQNPDTETTLIIFPENLDNFEAFLDFLFLAEELLNKQSYEGIYQLASFHPDYCFQGAEQDDPANYTNRSPYPMLHLIREKSIEEALKHYPSAEDIPQRNIEFARKQGLENLQKLLQASLDKEN